MNLFLISKATKVETGDLIEQEEVVAVKCADISAIPAGLTNQFESREQFLDLAQFLIAINGKGGAATEALRP